MSTESHPGIYVPPSLIYVAFFFLSFLLQKIWPIDERPLHATMAYVLGWVLIALYFLLAFAAIRQFVVSKNTLVPIKPATSLQTTGIYAFTRNPMYLSLSLLYIGIAIFFGNWWTLLLLPLLVMVLQLYVIRKEEQYLHHAFGEQYDDYKRMVRRWI